VEVLLRISNLLDTRRLQLKLKVHNASLEDAVRERTNALWEALGRLERSEWSLKRSQEETIQTLSAAAELRDPDTGAHIQRMSRYCALLMEAMGSNRDHCELVRLASQMHDVGKIGIGDDILLKPGPLTDEERASMQRHSAIGHNILAGGQSDLMKMAATIAWTHHERFDGTGYPRGIVGAEIPMEGRAAAVADVFDALISDRVYRPALALDEAIAIIRQGRGTHFDPQILDVFLELFQVFSDMREQFADEPDLSAIAVETV
jgi:putative two-component system response regulator